MAACSCPSGTKRSSWRSRWTASIRRSSAGIGERLVDESDIGNELIPPGRHEPRAALSSTVTTSAVTTPSFSGYLPTLTWPVSARREAER